MTTNFKAGDTVVLDTTASVNKNANGTLTTCGNRLDGRDLVVERTETSFGDAMVYLVGDSNGGCGYYATRFKAKPAIKVGDIVRIKDTPEHRRIGTLKENMGVHFEVTSVLSDFLNAKSLYARTPLNGWMIERFEIVPCAVKAAPKPLIKVEDAPVIEWIVMLKEFGKYAPATAPRVYSSEAQAIRVAKSMSEKHSGRFVVFKSIADADMPKPVPVSPTVRTFA